MKKMKKFIIALFTIGSFVQSSAQEIKWLSLNEALALQQKAPKPIFMDVYTDWCGPCKMLDAKTFRDKKFVEHISKSFYAVKFNAEGKSDITYKSKKYSNPEFKEGQKGRNGIHQFTNFLNLEGYPTMVIFDKKGGIVKTVVGFRNAEELISEIKI
jgi:thioredoxin-related protein